MSNEVVSYPTLTYFNINDFRKAIEESNDVLIQVDQLHTQIKLDKWDLYKCCNDMDFAIDFPIQAISIPNPDVDRVSHLKPDMIILSALDLIEDNIKTLDEVMP